MLITCVVLVSGYTTDDYTNIQSTLRNEYAADDYENIISIFGSDEIINVMPNKPTLNFPINKATNQSVNVTLNVTVTDNNGDNMNVNLMLYQDEENSYYADGINLMDIENSVDENWQSYGWADNGAGSGGEYFYENITIPLNVSGANWTYCLIYGTPYVSFWNYSSLSFEGNYGAGCNKTVSIPSTSLSDSILRVRTLLNKNSSNTRYYEGMVTWVVDAGINITNGSYATYKWLGLSYETTYYWFANVTDGSLTNTSDVWSFTTMKKPIVDTCTCSGNENCIVDCSDNCNFSIVNMNKYNVLITDVNDGIVGKVINIGNLKNATRIRIEGGCNGSK